jgi:hypothetical protein
MKFGELKSIGHNIADSLASGIGLLIGFYTMDVFGEASRSPEGYITVDFLTGTCTAGIPSPSLTKAVALYKDALADLCKRQGISVSEFRELTVKYISNTLDRRFIVAIEDQQGRRSSDEYVGIPGKRPKVLDHLGRARRK